MAEHGTCSNCKNSSWEREEIGSHSLLVCVECGECKEIIAFVADDVGPSGASCGSKLALASGPTSQGNYHDAKNPQRLKEVRFMKAIMQAAAKLNMSRQSTDRCISCGKILLRDNYKLGNKVHKIAAGLVFLELKARTPTLSFKDYSDQVGMKNTTLGRIVKGLKLHNRAELAGAPPDMCLQAVMDKLTMTKKLSAGMKMNVKKLAIELKDICADSPLHGKLINDNLTADCAYFILALGHLDPKQEVRSLMEMVTKDTGLHLPTLRNRLWKIKSVLLALAKTLPSLEHMSDQLTVYTIRRYIPTIIRNKTFLTKGTERFFRSDCLNDQGEKDCCAASMSPLCNEEEGSLSDLDSDVEQYIASEKEVEQKKANQRLLL